MMLLRSVQIFHRPSTDGCTTQMEDPYFAADRGAVKWI